MAKIDLKKLSLSKWGELLLIIVFYVSINLVAYYFVLAKDMDIVGNLQYKEATIIETPVFGDKDEKPRIKLRIEGSQYEYHIDAPIIEKVKKQENFEELRKLLIPNQKITLSKESFLSFYEYCSQRKVCTLSINGEDFYNEVDYLKEISWRIETVKIATFIAMVLTIISFVKQLLKFFRDNLWNAYEPPFFELIDIDKLEDFELGDFNVRIKAEGQIIEIDDVTSLDTSPVLISIDKKERKFFSRSFIFSRTSYEFDEIKHFESTNRDGVIYIQLIDTYGNEYEIMNTSSQRWIMNPNERVKWEIELTFLSIFNSVIGLSPLQTKLPKV